MCFCHDYLKNMFLPQSTSKFVFQNKYFAKIVIKNEFQTVISCLSKSRFFYLWFTVKCGYFLNFQNDRLQLPLASLCTFKIKPIFRFLENFQNILLSWKWRDLRKNLFTWTGFEVCRYSLFINEIFLSKHSEDSISKLGPRLRSYSALSRASGSWFIVIR